MKLDTETALETVPFLDWTVQLLRYCKNTFRLTFGWKVICPSFSFPPTLKWPLPQREPITGSSILKLKETEGLKAPRKARLHHGVVVKVRVLTTSFYLKRYLHSEEIWGAGILLAFSVSSLWGNWKEADTLTGGTENISQAPPYSFALCPLFDFLLLLGWLNWPPSLCSPSSPPQNGHLKYRHICSQMKHYWSLSIIYHMGAGLGSLSVLGNMKGTKKHELCITELHPTGFLRHTRCFSPIVILAHSWRKCFTQPEAVLRV